MWVMGMVAYKPLFEQARQCVYQKVRHMASAMKAFPHITQEGNWLQSEHGRWTSGFFVGLQWLDFADTGYRASRESAERWLLRMADRQYDCSTHDMGFLFGPSAIFGYRITKDEKLAEMAVQAARSLAARFRENAGVIEAWDDPGYEGVSIVDTAMNLPILFFAAEYANEPKLAEIGHITAKNIIRHFIRENGSTYHTARFDRNGKIMDRGTHQGYSKDSCWARGQSWALYGFTNLYRYTKQQEYLDAACKLANYFLKNLPDDRVPAWDLTFSNVKGEPKDAAAGAIASSGLLLLGQILQIDAEKDRSPGSYYLLEAAYLLEELVNNCLYDDLDRYGILLHATVDKPRNSGVDESCAYGDYYFAEALYRLRELSNNGSGYDALY